MATVGKAPRLAGCWSQGKGGSVDSGRPAGDGWRMLTAFALALGQFTDRKILGIFAKSLLVTLAVFAVLGTALWWGFDAAMAWGGFDENHFGAASGAAEMRGLAALLVVLLGGWLLWRIVAVAVLQFFADEVVVAVEQRHYPRAAARARRLGWREEMIRALAGVGRALLFNLLALPVALVLLVTGIGAPLVFWLVNSVLLGRELQDMVWLRHRPSPQSPPPLSGLERLMLGGVVTALLAVPLANFLAPFLGAAAAAHSIHRRGHLPDVV